jgi:hypothetical protein
MRSCDAMGLAERTRRLPRDRHLLTGRALRVYPLRQAALLLLGRSIDCHVCGRSLGLVLPLVWRGRLKLVGSAAHWIAVDWHSVNTLRFRHIELERCVRPSASDLYGA